MAEKTRNGGEWTESRFHSFVKSGLRSLSQKWPPKYRVLSKAYTGTEINPASGRLAKRYRCASCKSTFVAKDVEVNHIEPVVPTTGFDSWDNIIERLFCEESGLEVLCRPCHKIRTQEENKGRRAKTI